MARPLALDNPAADANGKRGDPKWVPITQAEHFEALGGQLPEATRIPVSCFCSGLSNARCAMLKEKTNHFATGIWAARFSV